MLSVWVALVDTFERPGQVKPDVINWYLSGHQKGFYHD